jgi:hypothetical protein
MVTVKTPNELEARYSNHLEEQLKRQDSPPQQLSSDLVSQSLASTATQVDEHVPPNEHLSTLGQAETSDFAHSPNIFPPQSSEPKHTEIALHQDEIQDRPQRDSEREDGTHQITAEILRYRKKSGFGALSWTLLILTSIAFGVGIMISIEADDLPPVDVDARVQSLRYDQGYYHMLVKLSSSITAQLLVPDDWVADENSDQFISIKGQREVILHLPNDVLSLGDNALHAQWLFDKTDQRQVPPRPAQIGVTLDWKLKEISSPKGQDHFAVTIQTLEGVTIVESDAPYEPVSLNEGYTFKVSKAQTEAQSDGAHLATINFTTARSTSQNEVIKQKYKATFLLPHEPVPLILSSPVRRYARPETHVVLSGRASPHAQIRLTQLELKGTKRAGEVPLVKTMTDAQGVFNLDIPLVDLKSSTTSIPTAGQTWLVTIEASTRGHLASRTTVTVKLSHKPTWDAYVNGLARRRNQASSRYRSLTQKQLTQKPDDWVNKAGKIPGVIAWIDRGLTEAEAKKLNGQARSQRLLVHTCQEGNGCPIWVEDPDAFWVKIGQKIHIFGVFLGMQSHHNAQGDLIKLPALKSRLTTP